ncbi:hypothetical protein VCRA2121O441_20251 [Vibrio crassostreae]|nr:hypothetical protein VCRA2118O429_10448 [Vibrio crassostreae]CAK1994628.1 hypothetical protein VCRA2113O413_20251 [Vibrio crassostreae]CAK1996114.1 hypothetical protein VCRA2114O423_20251 [Vibrio crassostreae]CAK1996887.1 hypothetical protein VCRA2113O412_20251 [Vibrio crassostreae]CAK2006532.1 hypothetical protein VCRA2113O414_20251 [Vibrio crassostreae]
MDKHALTQTVNGCLCPCQWVQSGLTHESFAQNLSKEVAYQRGRLWIITLGNSCYRARGLRHGYRQSRLY